MKALVASLAAVVLAIGVFSIQKLPDLNTGATAKVTSEGPDVSDADSLKPFQNASDVEHGDVAVLEGAVPGLQGKDSFVATSQGRMEGVDSRRIIQLSDWKPRAYLYKGFLTPEECDHIISVALPRMERSMVASNKDGSSELSNIRTSTGMFFGKGEDDVIRGIEQRVSEWTFLPVANQESLQVLRYKIGQKYEPHVDYFHDSTNTRLGGHRYATILMYLNDVEAGGETVFPEKKDDTPRDGSWSDCAKGFLAVKPQKGDALLFFSMHPDGTPDSTSLHYACPVLKGEKWSAPMWVRVADYTKTYKKESDKYGTKESYDEEDVEGVDESKSESESEVDDGSGCTNGNGMCNTWAQLGECEKNPEYMLHACKKACKAC